MIKKASQNWDLWGIVYFLQFVELKVIYNGPNTQSENVMQMLPK